MKGETCHYLIIFLASSKPQVTGDVSSGPSLPKEKEPSHRSDIGWDRFLLRQFFHYPIACDLKYKLRDNRAKPFRQKLRHINLKLASQIQKELQKMVDTGIIAPIRYSSWMSNLVVVRKKNGDIRICIDFRNLNKASQKDNFPLPTTEKILQSVAGSELMSFLNGFSGYNQIMVHPDDRLKTTFRTKRGTYAYQKMPF